MKRTSSISQRIVVEEQTSHDHKDPGETTRHEQETEDETPPLGMKRRPTMRLQHRTYNHAEDNIRERTHDIHKYTNLLLINSYILNRLTTSELQGNVGVDSIV